MLGKYGTEGAAPAAPTDLSREFLQNISILKLASCFKDEHRGCGANEFPLRPLHPVVNSLPYLLLNPILFVKVMKYNLFLSTAREDSASSRESWGEGPACASLSLITG